MTASLISPSRYLRTTLIETMGFRFNQAILAACDQYDIGGLAYALNFAGDLRARNWFEGNRSLDELVLKGEPDLPACTMWTADGQDQHLQKPRVFSGVIACYWRFFLGINGLRSSGLIPLREATEAALIDTVTNLPDGAAYRGDIAWGELPEQTWLDRDEQAKGFVQEVIFQATFEVNL